MNQLSLKHIVTTCLVFFLFACGQNDFPNNYPEKIKELPLGMEVLHNPEEVYATVNTKDPEKWGAYQLQFTTSVKAISEDLEIIEFGGYIWENEQWEFRSIYDRPFNTEEFNKWYGCENGILKKDKTYSDTDNWMGKTNYLSGREIKSLWYFIAKNDAGEKFVGAQEIVGYVKLAE
ncbi:MAG: hypothetical protein ACI8ZM_005218 [Crocinitomix sp.]|jgi:hypothetical protein